MGLQPRWYAPRGREIRLPDALDRQHHSCSEVSPNNFYSYTVTVRNLEWFVKQGVSEQIARVRYEHYEEKRGNKQRLIEEVLRNGSYAVMKDTFASPVQQKEFNSTSKIP